MPEQAGGQGVSRAAARVAALEIVEVEEILN
jgi:hypothetical protein